MESVPDWSGLWGDLLEQIAIRLVVKEDFTVFRGVCTSWRAAVAEDRYLNGSKLPMLLLPEKNGECKLYSLSERRIYAKIALPEAIGKTCLDVGFGWILTIAYPDGDVGMFKPLSRAKLIKLPIITDLLKRGRITTIKQAVLSDDPSLTTADLAIAANIFLSFCISDEGSRVKISGLNPYIGQSTCCCYDNMIFVLEPSGNIWVWNSCKSWSFNLMQVDKHVLSVTSNYLVESTFDDLLLISQHENPLSFSVIRIDDVRKQGEVTNDLRGDTIFLSNNMAFCVAADDYPGVLKPNCIYFANDFVENSNPRRKDMGIYNVQDQSLVEEFDFESSYSLSSPPLWIFP